MLKVIESLKQLRVVFHTMIFYAVHVLNVKREKGQRETVYLTQFGSVVGNCEWTEGNWNRLLYETVCLSGYIFSFGDLIVNGELAFFFVKVAGLQANIVVCVLCVKRWKPHRHPYFG